MFFKPIYQEKKEESIRLFHLFLKFKMLDYPEFVEKINVETGKNYDLKTLRNIIEATKKNISVSNGEIMSKILDNTLKIDKDIEFLNNVTKNNYNAGASGRAKKDHSQSIEKINKDIKEYISKRENNEEIPENLSKTILSRVKSNIRNIDKETYVQFLICYGNLEKYTQEELKYFLSVIGTTIKFLEEDLELLRKYNIENDEQGLYEFYIKGEENLDPSFKENFTKFAEWKIKKVSDVIKIYLIMQKNILMILDDKDLKDTEFIADSDLRKVKEEDIDIYNDYQRIRKIKFSYDRNVNGLNAINNKGKSEIKDLYIKRLLLENN